MRTPFAGNAAGLVLWASLLARPAHAEPLSPWAETARDEDLRAALVTFGPGDAIHQYFGHNALLIEDPRRDVAVLYNFGMFSFGPDMLPQYLQGQLEFWTAATPVRATYRSYVDDNRSIRVSELNLSPKARRSLAESLHQSVLPENRAYRYHHYDNNCSTKVRDFIDRAIGGQLLHRSSDRARLTHRGHTRRYTEQDPVVHMLLLLWMNDSMERPIREYDEAFLPDELERIVRRARYIDDSGQKVPLVRLNYTVFEADRPAIARVPGRGWPALLATGCVAGGLAVALALWLKRGTAGRAHALPGQRTVARVLLGLHHSVLGVVLGVPSLVAGLFLLTKWDVTHYNENLWLANPLTFVALPLGFWTIFGSERALRGVGRVWLALGASTLALMVLKVLPNFDQDVHLTMALFAPVNLGCAAAHWLLRRT